MVKWVMLLLQVQEALGSSLGPETTLTYIFVVPS